MLVNPRITRILGGVLAGAMACALYGALRFAYADSLARSDSSERVRTALKVAPGNASYWLHWADLVEAGGGSGIAGIQRAARLNPYDASVWIEAGLQDEIKGDYPAAEQDLLRAAQRSRQFEPRWALANFYFRRGDSEKFWQWAKSALEWSYQDRTPLFDLCWRMQPDAQVILDRGIPDNSKLLREYLYFLIESGRLSAAREVAARLGSQASQDDRDVLLAYANRMLQQHCWQDALAAWNALCLRKVVPYPPLDGANITNGSFSVEPLDSGFDWRLPEVHGVSAARSSSPPALRFDFDGSQPEYCWILYQSVPLKAGGRYQFRFGYRTDQIPAGTGLRWRVTDAATGSQIPVEPASLSSDDWTVHSLAVAVPPGVQMANLVLVYERQPGTVRIEGSVWLKDLALELQR